MDSCFLTKCYQKSLSFNKSTSTFIQKKPLSAPSNWCRFPHFLKRPSIFQGIPSYFQLFQCLRLTVPIKPLINLSKQNIAFSPGILRPHLSPSLSTRYFEKSYSQKQFYGMLLCYRCTNMEFQFCR